MRDKARRQIGNRTRGWGYKKHSAGSRGGVGRAGLYDHKRTTGILLERKARERTHTCIRDIESKLERYLRKEICHRTPQGLKFPCGLFCGKYHKVLSTGEPSQAYRFCPHVKLSKATMTKLLFEPKSD